MRITLISQLIKGISRLLKKFLRYFNETAVSTFTVPVLSILFKDFDLNINILPSGSSLHYCHKLPVAFE